MDQFNKAISFFLGLIVVVVFLAVATGKINLKGKTASVTPIPTPGAISSVTYKETSVQSKPTPVIQQNSPYRAVNSIPNTGPELLLPLVVSTFFGGSLLRQISRKK